jgi:hypothetical protein
VTNPSRRLLDAAAKVLPHALHPGGHAPRSPQTLTVERSAADVLAAVRDPAVLSRLVGDLGEVSSPVPGRYVWTLGGDAGVATHLVESPGGLDFLRGEAPVERVEDDTEGGAPAEDVALVSVRTRPAPHDLGTEVTVLVDVPTGAPAFTLLYRLRALLQTGEIPTISPQPAAREENH